MLSKYTRMKNVKSPKEKHKAIVRFISLCFVFVSLVVICILFSGCSVFKDSKQYEMKKSPCACFDKKA